MRWTLLAIVLVLGACQPAATATTTDLALIWMDGGASQACASACTVIAGPKFNCAEGKADDCASSFTSWDQGPAHIRRPDNGQGLTCAAVSAATSVAQLQAMGLTCTQADAGP